MAYLIATKENVWQHWKKMPNFLAMCNFCKSILQYVDITNFRVHILRRHKKHFIEAAIKSLQETPEVYFDKLKSQCKICKAEVQCKDFFCHLSLHSATVVENYIFDSTNAWKYCIQCDDFNVKCKICNLSVIELTIANDLKRHTQEQCLRTFINKNIRQETNGIVSSSEHSLSLETKAIFMPSNITGEIELSENYIKLWNFQAKCKFCSREFSYVEIQNFRTHLFEMHQKDFLYTVQKKIQDTPQIYFDKLNIKCFICKTKLEYFVPNLYSYFSYHLHSAHTVEEMKNYEMNKNTWEYCTQDSNYEVKCNFCGQTVTLSISKNLMDHTNIHSLAQKNTQVTSDIVGSSKRDLSRETNAMSVPPKITSESELWRYYIKLRNFRAQCKFCDFQYCYINISNFSKHIFGIHKEIIWYEKHGEGWPWMYFKYQARETVSCLLCQVSFPIHSDSMDCMITHLHNWHFLNTLDHHYDCGWEWKYCDKSDDSKVKCSVCFEEISLNIKFSHLNHHTVNTHLNELTNMRRTYDIPGPSGIQQN